MLPETVDIAATTETGFRLLDCLLYARRIIVLDTILTGDAPAGTVFVVREDDMRHVQGGSPHYVGPFEALELGRLLQQPVPDELLIVAVEGHDLRMVGGAMSEAVRQALPRVLTLVEELVQS